MSIRLIASVVVAALLMTGGAAAITNVAEIEIPPVKVQNIVLTQEEAKNIAINHAGLTEEEIRDLQVESDMERGVQKWDIDFHSGDWDFDYEINAETGALIKVNKEYDPVKVAKLTEPAPTKPAQTQPTEPKPTETQPPKTEKLSADEAKAIALKHAGLTEAEFLRTEYDVDDGKHYWDIDFRSGDWEYDYEINAETGAVIKGEKEYDPLKPAPSKPAQTQPTEPKPTETQPPKTEKLSAEEAKSIALKHAGLKSSQVKGLRAEYDVDDGIPEWEVEFYADGLEYSYEIHAETGKIRSWDKDRED